MEWYLKTRCLKVGNQIFKILLKLIAICSCRTRVQSPKTVIYDLQQDWISKKLHNFTAITTCVGRKIRGTKALLFELIIIWAWIFLIRLLAMFLLVDWLDASLLYINTSRYLQKLQIMNVIVKILDRLLEYKHRSQRIYCCITFVVLARILCFSPVRNTNIRLDLSWHGEEKLGCSIHVASVTEQCQNLGCRRGRLWLWRNTGWHRLRTKTCYWLMPCLTMELEYLFWKEPTLRLAY